MFKNSAALFIVKYAKKFSKYSIAIK